MQYINELEKTVTRLHTEISQLNPQVTFLRKKHQDLSSHNRALRERITALMQETQYKDQMNAHLREEVMRLKRQRESGGQAVAAPPPQQGSQPVTMLPIKPGSQVAGPAGQAVVQQPQQPQMAASQLPPGAAASAQGGMVMIPSGALQQQQQQQQQQQLPAGMAFPGSQAGGALGHGGEQMPWAS